MEFSGLPDYNNEHASSRGNVGGLRGNVNSDLFRSRFSPRHTTAAFLLGHSNVLGNILFMGP